MSLKDLRPLADQCGFSIPSDAWSKSRGPGTTLLEFGPAMSRAHRARLILDDAFHFYLMDFSFDRPPPANAWRAWAGGIERKGQQFLKAIGQDQFGTGDVLDGVLWLLNPGLVALDVREPNIAAQAERVFGDRLPDSLEVARRAFLAVDLLIAFVSETARYHVKHSVKGRPNLYGEATLVDHLAQGYFVLTGQPATVRTRPDTGEKYGQAVAFMRALCHLVATRIGESTALSQTNLPPDQIWVEPPAPFTKRDIVARLRHLALSPNALADRLASLKSLEGRPPGRPKTSARQSTRRPGEAASG